MARRIPYGYHIADGKAAVYEEEAVRLRQFFTLYLEGETMAAAARAAGLPMSPPAWARLFSKKAYAGTDFYPPIITGEYQEKLMARRREQKEENIRRGIGNRKPPGRVRIYTQFFFDTPVDTGSMEKAMEPAVYAAALYRRIVPVDKDSPSRKHTKT